MYRENEIEHLESQENTEWVNGLRLVSEELVSRPFDLNETCRSPLGLEGFDSSKISNNKPKIDHQYLPIYSSHSRSQLHSSQAHCHPNEYPVYANHCQNMCCFPYQSHLKHPMYENSLESQSIRMSRPVRWGYSDTYTTSSTQSSHTSTPKATHSWQNSPLPSPTSSVENFSSFPMPFPCQTILLEEEDNSDEVDSDSEDEYDLPFLATKKLSELDIHAKNSHASGNIRPVQYKNCTYDELLMSQFNHHLSSSDSIKDPQPRRKASEYARNILMDWLVANKGTA